jgi:hypothetical protein
LKTLYNEPGYILSNPRHKTQFAYPDLIACIPKCRAAEPVQQLLFTFIIGIPVIPTLYNALYPLQLSPYTYPTNAYSIYLY